MLNSNKKNRVRILNIKIFCFFKELFDFKQFVNFNKLCFKKKINFEKFVDKAIQNRNTIQKSIS